MDETGKLLIFGRSGQVARELAARAPCAVFAGRDRVDLERPADCAGVIEALRPTAIINAAAWTAVDAAEEHRDAAFGVNAEAPGAMAEAAAGLGVPLVHISTDYVFDGSGDAARRPDAVTGPLGVYGASKLAGERRIADAGGVHAVLRTSWVFSSHGTNFVKTMLRLSETRDRLTIVADQVGGPTPAAAIAEACLNVASQLGDDAKKTGTYHFAGRPDVSWADFAREIFRQAGRETVVTDIPTSEYPTPAPRPLNSRLDCTTVETVFGIARPDWKEALRRVLNDLEAA